MASNVTSAELNPFRFPWTLLHYHSNALNSVMVESQGGPLEIKEESVLWESYSPFGAHFCEQYGESDWCIGEKIRFQILKVRVERGEESCRSQSATWYPCKYVSQTQCSATFNMSLHVIENTALALDSPQVIKIAVGSNSRDLRVVETAKLGLGRNLEDNRECITSFVL